MVKLVRNKTLEDYESRTEELSKTNKELEETIQRMNDQKSELDEMVKSLQDKLDAFSDENSLVLTVSDDLTHVTPVVRVKREMFEKMVELGYLNDTVTTESKPFAMQLALMTVCVEALEQIVESFSAKIDE